MPLGHQFLRSLAVVACSLLQTSLTLSLPPFNGLTKQRMFDAGALRRSTPKMLWDTNVNMICYHVSEHVGMVAFHIVQINLVMAVRDNLILSLEHIVRPYCVRGYILFGRTLDRCDIVQFCFCVSS